MYTKVNIYENSKWSEAEKSKQSIRIVVLQPKGAKRSTIPSAQHQAIKRNKKWPETVGTLFEVTHMFVSHAARNWINRMNDQRAKVRRCFSLWTEKEGRRFLYSAFTCAYVSFCRTVVVVPIYQVRVSPVKRHLSVLFGWISIVASAVDF